MSAKDPFLTTPVPSPLLDAYLEKRDMLLRLFSKSLGDAALAEDVIQDLYLKIAALSPDYQVDNPSAFLFRAANNIYLNRLRSQKSGINREHAWQESNAHVLGGDLVDDKPDAEAQVVGRQQLTSVLASLEELPEKTQQIFRLHKFEGLSQPEVAARLEISISSVEKHLSAALKHLMTRLRTGGGRKNGP